MAPGGVHDVYGAVRAGSATMSPNRMLDTLVVAKGQWSVGRRMARGIGLMRGGPTTGGVGGRGVIGGQDVTAIQPNPITDCFRKFEGRNHR